MAISPVQVSSPAAVSHQGLADKFYDLLKGAEAYVEKWLPEHPNKQHVLTSLQATWDNTVSVIKGDLAATEAAAAHAAEQASHTVATDAEGVVAQAAPAAEKVAEDAAAGVVSAVEDVVPTVPAAPAE